MKPSIDLPFIRLTPDVRAKLHQQIDRLPDGDYAVAVVSIDGPPSWKQHKYYRGHVCHVFAMYRAQENQEEFDLELAHDILAGECLPEGIESTADLTRSQMWEYTEACRNWLARFDIQTQPPDPAWRERQTEVA